jgi:hypothetical protein
LKPGLNLATRPVSAFGVFRAVGWFVALLGLVGSVIHLHAAMTARRGTEVLREDVERLESRLAVMERGMVEAQEALASPASSEVIRMLVAVEASGAIRAASPTQVLTMLAEVLPPKARVLSLKLQSSSPQPELVLEAMAESSEPAARLLGELSHYPSVIRAAILDERHLESGEIHLRIRVVLDPEG